MADYVDDLELLEEHDLFDSASDASDREHAAGDSGSASESEPDDQERIDQLRGPVLSICSALGGYEEVARPDGTVESVYQLGDDCLGCLRDLRKLWRQDDEDPSRAVARVYASINVLHNDLVPILLRSAGTGERGSKIVLACTDLITALTWPIDMMAELQDAEKRDEDSSHITSLPQLEQTQVQYKASILRSKGPNGTDVLGTVMRHVLLPSLGKPRRERTERDVGTISMCLHLFRNLLAIRDPRATSLSSAETLANSSLQSLLVIGMARAHILETLLMLASSSETAEFNQWNAVTLDCIHHIFMGSRPAFIATAATGSVKTQSNTEPTSGAVRPSTSSTNSALSAVLEAEARASRSSRSTGAARHSRFGTTITYRTSDGQRRAASSQAALRKSEQQLADELEAKRKKRGGRRKRRAADEKGAPRKGVEWNREAVPHLVVFADRFLQNCFEPLTRSVLKDIRSEREKLGPLDVARVNVMMLGAFFLEYFCLRRAASGSPATGRERAAGREVQEQNGAISSLKGKERAVDGDAATLGEGVSRAVTEGDADETMQEKEQKPEWDFALVAEWLEPWAFKLVLVRSETALQDKRWLEFKASVQLWTVLLRLLDALAHSSDEEHQEVAQNLQNRLYYESSTLDAVKGITQAYKSQSFSCLDSIIQFSYFMPKMLERYATNKDYMYVRAKKNRKKKSNKTGEDADGQEDEDEAAANAEEAHTERVFQFETFQAKLASRKLADACVMYLEKWIEFVEPEEELGRVVGVMHRMAVKAGQWNLFCVAWHLKVFRSLTNDLSKLSSRAPRSSEDLKKLITFIQRKFDKLPRAEKAKYAEGKRPTRAWKAPKMPAEIVVKAGKPPSEQMGIAIGLLLEKGKMEDVMWVKNALEMASAQRQEIIAHTDMNTTTAPRAEGQPERGNEDGEDADQEEDGEPRRRLLGDVPSEEAVSRFEAYELSYDGNERIQVDASRLPELKLLLRLVGLESVEDNPLQWVWTIPARILPTHLNSDARLIEQFITSPLDTDGTSLGSLIQRVRKPTKRRAMRAPSSPNAQRRTKERKEALSERFIIDSDVEAEVDGDGEGEEAFLEKERERERMYLKEMEMTAAERRAGALELVKKGAARGKAKAKAAAAAAMVAAGGATMGEEQGSNDSSNESEQDSEMGSPSPSPSRPGPGPRAGARALPRPRARPTASALARNGAAGGGSRHSSSASTPPTSSPPPVGGENGGEGGGGGDGRPKRKSRPGTGLFLGSGESDEDGEEEEEEEEEEDGRIQTYTQTQRQKKRRVLDDSDQSDAEPELDTIAIAAKDKDKDGEGDVSMAELD